MLAINTIYARNPIRQLAMPATTLEGEIAGYRRDRFRANLFSPADGSQHTILTSTRPSTTALRQQVQVLYGNGPFDTSVVDLSSGLWLKHPAQPDLETIDYTQVTTAIPASWRNALRYILEDQTQGLLGFRRPQLGALHAVHAHWAVSSGVATVVMPTGTGKTDTMIAIILSAGCQRTLVVVPSDALRTQISERVLTLGALRLPGSQVLRSSVEYPIVGTILHIPSREDIETLFARCNVLVTTSSILASTSPDVQEHIAALCPYLFIDEAHHAEAPTWRAFRERFADCRVLQFTATPFREDGKPLDGKIIFNYPLRLAQRDGYFKPITFDPVLEFAPSHVDHAIAKKAISHARAHFALGHIVMARVDSIKRAEEIAALYAELAPDLNPVQLHTGIKSAAARKRNRESVLTGNSRIVVCVDMLGEGFDLPELKIAAFHDIRRSLAVTLQLAGRFVRARADLGNPVFIANTADVIVQEELRKLYSRDPDWNVLLPELSEGTIGEQVALQEFLAGFTTFPGEIPLKEIRPALSTIVYRASREEWQPERFREGIPGINTAEQVHSTLNASGRTLIVVTVRRTALPWIDSELLHTWSWDLYVAIWRPELQLLFLNTSANAGDYRELAEALAGPRVEAIKGQNVFRAFAGINRLRLQNVGLTERRGRNIRYIARMGSDVEPALPEAQRRNTSKSVLSGSGFEHGRPATAGASKSGRIWSHSRGSLPRLVEWCTHLGAKLLDETLDPDEILAGTLEVRPLDNRPNKMPIAVDWPEVIYTHPEAYWSFDFADGTRSLSEVAIELVDPSEDGPLLLSITDGDSRVVLELQLYGDEEASNYSFKLISRDSIRVSTGATSTDILELFDEFPPVIWFYDGSSLEGNQFVELRHQDASFDVAAIQDWDWTNTNLTIESQGEERNPASIQARVIAELERHDYQIIFDDDATGEAADVVAIRVANDGPTPSAIDVELYHLKYAHGGRVSTRIDNLYELCGQAQKSIWWMSSPEKQTDLFTHLLRRNAQRIDRGRPTRFQRGTVEELVRIREISRSCPLRLKVLIVQPGLSKSQTTIGQRHLLSVTQQYLWETYQLPFAVIGSA